MGLLRSKISLLGDYLAFEERKFLLLDSDFFDGEFRLRGDCDAKMNLAILDSDDGGFREFHRLTSLLANARVVR
ncbi:hypothetical protein RHOFW510R12_07640 [Rhodanobacter sp. FW510-R12]